MELQADHPGTVLFSQGLTLEATTAVLQVAADLGLCVSWAASDGAYCNPETTEHQGLLCKYESLEGVTQSRGKFGDMLQSGLHPLKLVAFSNDPDADAGQAQAMLESSLGLRVIAAEMHIEFLDGAVSKGGSLVRICKGLGVPMQHVAAIGDHPALSD